jgi:hypothetical protein
VLDETETPDLITIPKLKAKQQTSALLNSRNSIPKKDPVNQSFLRELWTNNEDSDDTNSSTSGSSHRLRPSLIEKETQMRTDLKKDQIKPKMKTKKTKKLAKVNFKEPEKGNPL